MATTLPPLDTCTVAIVGLGYVGLPLAVEFAKPQLCRLTGASLQRRVIGFDINSKRLEELHRGIDRTNETCAEELQAAQLLEFTSDPAQLAEADVFVVTVPTPIDSAKRPDLTPLVEASASVGHALKLRRSASTPVVIYESTVYPGATEEICVPILERESGFAFNEGFCCCYSPERINPGDNEHKLTTITKVTSGSTAQAAAWVDFFYGSIIEAGTHLAPTIKVAEAAKVIENTQRDLNIALVNELAMIFRQMGIDTRDVLEAAGTKWNFLPFRPGLVGGHCIGVDPYYLTHKAEQLGYHPQLVLAGRRINDGMGRWVVEQLVLEMARRGQVISGAKVLVLGLTFKENCPDLRNTRVVDVILALQCYGIEPVLVDPWVDAEEALSRYGLTVHEMVPGGNLYGAVIAAVAHKEFSAMSEDCWRELLPGEGVLLDLQGVIPRALQPWRL
ncbi:nucleotide sugar dehydrogenase [Cyanobium sp. Alchichica 3B3-8F6]|uniref:nucleotide sugar dehydrogenase n=1 Tax=Cyanobium sp. Alchichica 3B3-8F6 TaxID=2823696 RepID=UPI0020CB6C33|nr:nucleotide sugar dehydrogenase [Cyanobium sp. Alchichica 3B3-8F6]MCP9882398.1 nucleotide sugar dehydrogenase [Cyanobium sp. Alchichica 3B3-8F6]